MTLFAIIDNGAGLFQWAGEAADKAAAIKAHADDIGADVTEIDARVYAVTAAQVEQLEAWAAENSPAREFPLAGTRPE